MPTAFPIPADGTLVDTAWLNALGSRLIATVVADGSTASVSFQNPPTSYKHLLVVWKARETAALASDFLGLTLNNAFGGSQCGQVLRCSAASVSTAEQIGSIAPINVGVITGASAGSANDWGVGWFILTDYTDGTINSGWAGTSCCWTGQATSNGFAAVVGGNFNNAAAITKLALSATAGNLAVGSIFSLYGLG